MSESIVDRQEKIRAKFASFTDPDDKWKETEAYFDLTASPAKITISSMYALAPNGGGGDYSTDPQAPHGGSYDYEQLSCTADFREGMDQRATAHSVKYPQDGEINFCDYSIQYLSEKGSLPSGRGSSARQTRAAGMPFGKTMNRRGCLSAASVTSSYAKG